jgi:hypothetical protein
MDTFRYEDDPDSPGSQGPLHKVKQDQIGGGGTYGKPERLAVILFSAADVTPSGRVAAIGARMWYVPPARSSNGPVGRKMANSKTRFGLSQAVSVGHRDDSG